MFLQLLDLAQLVPPPGSYLRVWTPLITLWYLIWQRLNPNHTLQAVLIDARRGGVDRLSPKNKPLSKSLRSRATTSYSDARQRLSLTWVRECFLHLAQKLRLLGSASNRPWPVEVLDGSTQRCRPHGDIPKDFPPHRTRRRTNYWCLGRVLISFCADTGLAMQALICSIHRSEQAMAVQMMLETARQVLYIADRNFGVWRVARAAQQSGAQALFRLTKARARCLFGKKRLPQFLDRATPWVPTAHDQVDPGLRKESVAGRLVIIKASRPGFRPQALYLFTTLSDVHAYPPERLLEMYGWRWRAELNYRTVKATMEMDQSQAKSAEMVGKEFYAGLMAYNLVRGLMTAAAEQANCSPNQLSFAKVRLLLVSVVLELWINGTSRAACDQRLQWLLDEAAASRLPHRSKPRQNEPRAQYYEPQVFPKLKGSRADARRAMKKRPRKS